jgi:hypothetical protein
VLLPHPFCWWVDKGEDCQSVEAEHHWYNQDGERDACYHCKVVRAATHDRPVKGPEIIPSDAVF